MHEIGYEQFRRMRSDPALCFKALCGEEPVSMRKKKKGKQETKLSATPGGKVGGSGDGGGESEASDSGEEEEEESEGEMESGPSTPASHTTPTGKRYSYTCHVYVLKRCACIFSKSSSCSQSWQQKFS